MPQPLTIAQAQSFRLAFRSHAEGERGIEGVIRAMQVRLGVDPDGEPGPLTMGAYNRLVPAEVRVEGAPVAAPVAEAAGPAGYPAPAWFEEGRRRMGLHERTDKKALAAWLASDGHFLGDPSQLPWCGDFVETCVRTALPAEPIPDNPYLARNWMRFGVEAPMTLGAVAVFWRGSRHGTAGHVGFVAGYRPGYLYVLGGNQSDRITIAPLAENRLLGCRWPKTVPLPSPRYLPAMSGGSISTNEA